MLRIKDKGKYWYYTLIMVCAECNHRDVYRYRVYKEEQKGTTYQDNLCTDCQYSF